MLAQPLILEPRFRAGDAAIPKSSLGKALYRGGFGSGQHICAIEDEARRQDVSLRNAFRFGLNLSEATISAAALGDSNSGIIDPVAQPPDPRVFAAWPLELVQRDHVMPWRKIGNDTVVLATDKATAKAHHKALKDAYGSYRIAFSTAQAIDAATRNIANDALIARAESMVAKEESCRDWNAARALVLSFVAIGAVVWLYQISPELTLGALYGWTIATLVLLTALKLAAVILALKPRKQNATEPPLTLRMPTVSILVPLFREKEIARHLVRRLSRIDYPHALLDVCLLVEQEDLTTRQALLETPLPRWMRAIPVPQGTLQTKPRALNYGLGFTRGSIVGIYDAEDAPDPQQIQFIAKEFMRRPQNVACLQGVLDFYNAGQNWLSRCFAIEYATWFRIVLPGLERLGLVIPLGGTTLFFRRHVLEELGGWDAHNVTEDADLGVRLARHGYKTELVPTVTHEEANCRTWPWIKQRSRWLKGYAITYGVHMRQPSRLLRDLGLWRFFGVQLLFLGSLTQFALAPLLWSFWAIPLGLGHPLGSFLPSQAFALLGAIFLAAELTNLAAAVLAARMSGRKWLIKWAPTLHVYFPLAALAAWKGLAELLWKPFYWDKTEHGIGLPDRK